MSGTFRTGMLRQRSVNRIFACVAALGFSSAGCSSSTMLDASVGPTVSDSAAVSAAVRQSPAPSASSGTFAIACPTPDTASGSPAAGIADLPSTAFDCLGGGQPVRLTGYADRPLIVHIWASWCDVCREEMPEFVSAASRLPSNVRVIGIAWKDNAESARGYAAAAGLPFPSILDPQGALGARWRVSGQPTTVFIRAGGSIAHAHQGPFASADAIADAERKYLR